MARVVTAMAANAWLLPSRRRLGRTSSRALQVWWTVASAGNQAAMFEPIQHRVERCSVEREGALGTAVDLERDVVSMARLHLELRQNRKFGRPLFQKLSSAVANI